MLKNLMVAILLFFVTTFFELFAFAKPPGVDASPTPLKVTIGSYEEKKIGVISGDEKLFAVPKKNWVEFWVRDSQLTRLGPTTFELVFSRNIHLIHVSNGELKTFTLDKITASLPEDLLDLIMKLEVGSIVTDSDGSSKKAESFIQLMKQQGFSQKMFDQFTDYVPMRVLEIKSMSMEFDIDKLLFSKTLPEASVSYQAKLIVPSMFRKIEIKEAPIALSSVGETLTRGPFLDAYTSAYQDLINRYDRLKMLGWHRAFIERNLEKRFDDDQKISTNLVPLSQRRKCSAIFETNN